MILYVKIIIIEDVNFFTPFDYPIDYPTDSWEKKTVLLL